MQGGLVDHGAEDVGGAVVLVDEAQSVEPGRPSGAEMSSTRISHCWVLA